MKIPDFLTQWALTKGAKIMFDKLWAVLDGKKAYIGGVAFILTGLGQIGVNYYNGQGFSQDGWKEIMAGWAIIAAKSAVAKTEPKP